MKDGETGKGRLRLVTIWPLLMFPFIIAATLSIFFIDHEAGLAALIFACFYLLFCVWWTLYWRPKIDRLHEDAEAPDRGKSGAAGFA